MASNPLATMTSRISLLPRSLTSSSSSPILSTNARRAASRSITSQTRHKSYRQTSSSSLQAFRTAHLLPATPTLIPSRLKSTTTTTNNNSSSTDSSLPEIKSYKFEDITPSPTKSQILIDVREPAELTSTGIIPTSLCIPLASHPDALFLSPSEFLTRFGFPKPGHSETDPSQEPTQAEQGGEGEGGGGGTPKIVFYCKAGVRARTAAQLAVKAGYRPEELGVYDGSWIDWAKKGGRVERWEGEED